MSVPWSLTSKGCVRGEPAAAADADELRAFARTGWASLDQFREDRRDDGFWTMRYEV